MPSGKDVSKTEGMTPRERLTAALRCQPLDRVPWTVDLAYYDHAMQEQGKFPAGYDGVDGFLRQHEELGVDPYFYYPCFWAYEDVYEGVKKETRQSAGETVHSYTLNGKTLTEVKGPFIMGSADQVPPDGDISRVRIVSDMIAERQLAN